MRHLSPTTKKALGWFLIAGVGGAYLTYVVGQVYGILTGFYSGGEVQAVLTILIALAIPTVFVVLGGATLVRGSRKSNREEN